MPTMAVMTDDDADDGIAGDGSDDRRRCRHYLVICLMVCLMYCADGLLDEWRQPSLFFFSYHMLRAGARDGVHVL